MRCASKTSFLAVLLLGSTASAEMMMPCMEMRAWPTDQVQTSEQMPFNIMFWLPPIDPAFTYNLCRTEFISGQRTTRCIRLLQAEDMEPLPWPENPMTAHEIERDAVAIDDEEWQELLERDCWELQAIGTNGPVDFLGMICPRGPADTEAPQAPTVSAFYERPVWGAPSQSAGGMDDNHLRCDPFSNRAGTGQLRLQLTREDSGPTLIHVQVFAGDDLLLDSARPFGDRLTLNVEIGSQSPETLRVQARVIDVAGQLSPWADAKEIIDERTGGCACTGSEPWALGLLALGLIRNRRRRG